MDIVGRFDRWFRAVIEGDVESRSLTVGINAKVKGSVSADDARICGTVEGEVKASSVIVAETARVIGDVVHEKLSVETGAYLEGNCRHMSANGGKQAKLSVLKTDDEAKGKSVPGDTKAGEPMAS